MSFDRPGALVFNNAMPLTASQNMTVKQVGTNLY